jgi:hypothetical protein
MFSRIEVAAFVSDVCQVSIWVVHKGFMNLSIPFNMVDSLGRLIDQLYVFFTIHFFEILLIIVFLEILDVALFFFASNKKDKVIIFQASWLSSQTMEPFLI